MGCDPDRKTLRELSIMAEAKDRQQWNHTAALMATIRNANCYEEKDLVTIIDMHPYLEEPRIEISIGELGKAL